MTQGLQIWDENGDLVLDVTDRLTRIIGQVGPVSAPGSMTVPQFAQGDPWAFVLQRNSSAGLNSYRCASVTITGTTMTWDFPGLSTWPIQAATILYGLY